MRRSLMRMVGIESLETSSCTSELGVMFLHIFVSMWATEPHGGRLRLLLELANVVCERITWRLKWWLICMGFS